MSTVPEPNPFAPPTARVDDIAETEQLLAGRGQRLGAVMIDGLIQGALYFALVYTVLPSLKPSAEVQVDMLGTLLKSLALGLLLFVLLQGYLLHTRGQTIGKRLLGIRILRSNGERASFARLVGLRFAVGLVITMIPLIGAVFGLLDSLLIFRESRKCLHDNIADTIVVQA